MERAYQQARDYAKTRVQSRDVKKPKDPPVTIIHHPDVRRMLLWMKAAMPRQGARWLIPAPSPSTGAGVKPMTNESTGGAGAC